MRSETLPVPSQTSNASHRVRPAGLLARFSAQGDTAPQEKLPEGAVETELPDVTGVLVLCLVTLGLFILPLAVTLSQGPAILSGVLH